MSELYTPCDPRCWSSLQRSYLYTLCYPRRWSLQIHSTLPRGRHHSTGRNGAGDGGRVARETASTLLRRRLPQCTKESSTSPRKCSKLTGSQRPDPTNERLCVAAGAKYSRTLHHFEKTISTLPLTILIAFGGQSNFCSVKRGQVQSQPSHLRTAMASSIKNRIRQNGDYISR